MSISPDLQLVRIRGCILGGALGDAIGLFTEFFTREQALEIYPPCPPATLPRLVLAASPLDPPGTHTICQDRHRALFESRGWTDDTDQSLLILLSFLRSYTTPNSGTLDHRDFAVRLRSWVASGLCALDRLPLGVGRTVGGVVGGVGYLDDPTGAATALWERTGRGVAANGAVMRTAVIGCLLFPDVDGTFGVERSMSSAIEIASTTHADPRCLISCAIVSGTVAAIMRGSSPITFDSLRSIVSAAKSLLATHEPPLSAAHLEELDDVLWVNNVEDLNLAERTSIGYTYKCLGAGIWALRQAIEKSPASPQESAILFEQLITQLTMQAGDADTNCAVAGSLLGCFLTSAGLPPHWTASLLHSAWLVQKSDAAASLLSIYPSDDDFPGLSPPPTYTRERPYDAYADADTLVDAGKGELVKQELDRRWLGLIRSMEARVAAETRGKPAAKRIDGGRARGEKDKDMCIVM